MDIQSSPAADARPPRSAWARVAVIVPVLVAVATAALLLRSAWPVLRPARTVRVEQVVFDRSTQPASDATTRNDNAPSRDWPMVQAAGWLEAEPFTVACTALADGVVESIDVLEGDHVEKGQVVGRLVAEDSELRLRRAEAELARAEGVLSTARAERVAAQTAWSEPVELERAVDAGLAALDEARAELAQLPSLVESAKATLIRLEAEAERAERSRQAKASTDLEVIIADQRVAAHRAEIEAIEAREPALEARVHRLAAELRAAERDLDLRIEDRRRLDVAAAAVTAAEADVANAAARRDEAALELDRMTIHAPITCYVERRIKRPGDKVARMMDDPYSAHLVHLYDPDRLQVRVDVPLADASYVVVDQPCEVVVEVLPDRTFTGRVLRVTHQADVQKNTLEVKVKVLDPDPVLRPEMLTRVRFLPPNTSAASETQPQTASSTTRVLVPRDAIDERSGAPRLWLVTNRRAGRGELRPVDVRTIESRDDWTVVAADIDPGALLTPDFDGAEPGEPVVIREATPSSTQGGGS